MTTIKFPPNGQRPRWWQLINPFWLLFGNADDGLYGDDGWRAGRAKTVWLAVQWWYRNPFHNLTFYGLGFAHRGGTGYGTQHEHASGVGWFVSFPASGPLRWVPHPCVIFRPAGWSGYIGWRPWAGAVGLKFRSIR